MSISSGCTNVTGTKNISRSDPFSYPQISQIDAEKFFTTKSTKDTKGTRTRIFTLFLNFIIVFGAGFLLFRIICVNP